MKKSILLYPSMTDELYDYIKPRNEGFDFFYIGDDFEEYELTYETDDLSDILCIDDKNGIWNPDDYNLGVCVCYSLKNVWRLFGKDGIVCSNARLGIAVQWMSFLSKQRGAIRLGEFCIDDDMVHFEKRKVFEKAQLRNDIVFQTIIYISKSGTPDYDEQFLANESGYTLGVLDRVTIRIDGSGSVFPVFEISDTTLPLWSVKCDWLDPTSDLFGETVSINLNKAHKNFSYIDRSKRSFNGQLLSEIMASAITQIIEKVRNEEGYWEQIMQGDELTEGSVGQMIYYFKDTLEWNMNSAEEVSLSARRFFDQRMVL